MAASRPAQARAENATPTEKQKMEIWRRMGVDSRSLLSRAHSQQPSKFTPITASPFELTRIPQSVAPTGAVARPAPRPPMSLAGPSHPSDWVSSTKAGVRGAIDSLPLELGNYIPATVSAIGDATMGGNFGSAFRRRLDAERGQDRYDQANHPTARLVGDVAGNLVQIAVPGMGAARVARIAQATPLLHVKEMGKLIAMGGGLNAAAEGIVDGARGEFSLAKTLGAGLGGAVGTVTALKGRPGMAGAVTGGATSVIQDILDGNVNSGSLARASDAAATGSLIAGGAGRIGAMGSNRLPVKTKGKLGEWLSERRTGLRGDGVTASQQKVAVKGGNTVADHITAGGETVEAKFGRYARLSPRQLEGYRSIPGYRVDHFLPRDIGAMIETPLGMLMYQSQSLADRQPR